MACFMRNICYRSRLMARGPVFRGHSLQIHHTHGYVSIKTAMTEEQITVFKMGFSFPVHYLKKNACQSCTKLSTLCRNVPENWILWSGSSYIPVNTLNLRHVSKCTERSAHAEAWISSTSHVIPHHLWSPKINHRVQHHGILSWSTRAQSKST